MADTIEVNEEDVRQAKALEQALGADRRLEALDICGAWKVVKPFWPWIIKAVKKIPRIGEAIAKALEFLGEYLDAHCK